MSPRFLTVVVMLLTASTGVVDAVSFLTLGHVFTANMTGNVVFIAFATAGVANLSVARSGTALVAFLAGAAVAGGIARDSKAASQRLGVFLFGEGMTVLVASAVAARAGSGLAEGHVALYSVIGLTACAMGVQSAIALRLAVPGLMPNVVTGALTLIVSNSRHDAARTRRVVSVFSLFTGALVGAWLCRFSTAWPLAVSGLMAMACALAIASVTRTDVSRAST